MQKQSVWKKSWDLIFHGQSLWTDQQEELSLHGYMVFFILACLVGIAAGFGAVAFRYLIAIIHNVFFLWTWSFNYNDLKHTPHSFWGWAILFVPVYGAIIVSTIVKYVAPETRGHGVPEALDSIYYNKARIRPIVGVLKAIASAITIGTGGSVGREGPIIQIGASFGSFIGLIVKMPPRQRAILLAAGGCGGIAATFGAPFAGVAFAMEILLVSSQISAILPVAMASVIATYIARFFFNLNPLFPTPLFHIPPNDLLYSLVLLWFIPFGLLTGLLATAFVRGLYFVEDLFNKIPGGYYTRHCLGMLMVGGAIAVYGGTSSHYYIQGLGYATIQNILYNTIGNPLFLLLLCFSKLCVTNITLGSGGSGGVFSPSLFMGASFGALCGICLNYVMPGLHMDPRLFALAGMAAMVGASTGGVITGILLTVEMTHDYRVIMATIIATTVAYAVRKFYCYPNIYTLKILRRGHALPEGIQAGNLSSLKLEYIMTKNIITHSLKIKNNQKNTSKYSYHIIKEQGEIIGYKKNYLGKLSQLKKNFIILNNNSNLLDALRNIPDRNSVLFFISNNKKPLDIIGVVTEKDMLTFLRQQALMMV